MSERRFVLVDFTHMNRAGLLRLYEAGHRDQAATKGSGPYVSPRSARRPGHAGANQQSGPSTG